MTPGELPTGTANAYLLIFFLVNYDCTAPANSIVNCDCQFIVNLVDHFYFIFSYDSNSSVNHDCQFIVVDNLFLSTMNCHVCQHDYRAQFMLKEGERARESGSDRREGVL
jgi:hypothetical protein